jgi:hypothetical protein
VFLLHSNVDRLFARWQTEPGQGWRLDPAQVYGSESYSTAINANLQPWAGTPPITRPWAHPENEQQVKNSRDATVVTPHLYEGNRRVVPPGFSRVGRFTASGRDELLAWDPNNQNYWLGQFNGTQIQYTLSGNTAGFGGGEGVSPFWIGEFSGSGKSETLFWYPGDQNYWLGQFNGTQIQYTLAGNTAGFGGGEGVSPFWIGDFTGSGKTETLFWYPGDGNYWLGRFAGTNLSYTFAGNS